MNSSAYGLTRIYTSNAYPSYMTFTIKSGFGMGWKDECTRVSSRSSTRVFIPSCAALWCRRKNLGGSWPYVLDCLVRYGSLSILSSSVSRLNRENPFFFSFFFLFLPGSAFPLTGVMHVHPRSLRHIGVYYVGGSISADELLLSSSRSMIASSLSPGSIFSN